MVLNDTENFLGNDQALLFVARTNVGVKSAVDSYCFRRLRARVNGRLDPFALSQPTFLNNLRTAIQPDPTHIVVSFSLTPK